MFYGSVVCVIKILSFCFFTVDNVMVAMKKIIFKHVDPVQDFILRMLFGELKEVNSKSSKSEISIVVSSGWC